MSKPNPVWRTLGGFSGPVITGTMKTPPITSSERRHVIRADYLTFMVESGGMFGGIMAADGTVITAGRGQHALVLPRVNAIGDLPKLLQRMSATKSTAVMDLLTAMKEDGLWINSHGVLMTTRHGVDAKATPIDVRIIMSVEDGKVPKEGADWDRAAGWALAFCSAFSDPVTFATQEQFDIEQLIDEFGKLRVMAQNGQKVNADVVIYGTPISVSTSVPSHAITEERDLIMCLWHSFKVNAPNEAKKVLEKALYLTGDSDDYRMSPVERVPLLLATSSYGRWNKSIPNGRWNRTMKIVRDSKIWSQEVIDRVTSKVQ